LKRADLVVSTKDSSSGSPTADLVVEGLVDRFGNPVVRQIAGDVLAFCGIAKPESFFQLVRASGARVDTMCFRDHHPYTRGDIRRISWRARGKDLIITTEKDLIRLMPEQLNGRWHALRVKMEIPELDRIIEEIETRAKNRRISR
jgi:tetraacyldisaccharide-1-P 4'-kinase